jgi:hypothetical protein
MYTCVCTHTHACVSTAVDLDLGSTVYIVDLSVPFYRQDARGIGHADGLDWAPNSVGARCLWRHHVH